MADRPLPEPAPCLLIYDGQCRLCVTSKQGLERLSPPDPSRPVRFVPYQSDEARSVLGKEYRLGRPEVAFLVESDGSLHRGLDAFLPLLPGLPGGRFLSLLLKLPFLRPLSERLYRLVARNRYRWFGEVSR